MSFYFYGDIEETLEFSKNKPKYLLEPLLPLEGIVLLHGESSLGKTPLCWGFCQAVSEGVPFLGSCPSTVGDVLWIEADEPISAASDRLRGLAPRPRRMFIFGAHPCSLESLDPEAQQVLADAVRNHPPKLVVLNSLNMLNSGDFKDPHVVKRFYGAIRQQFAGACIIVIHHDNKPHRGADGRLVPSTRHDFSGSQAWLAQSQVGLHITSRGAHIRHRQIKLEVTKSQVGQLGDTWELTLGADGFTWEETGGARARAAFRKLPLTIPLMERYDLVAEELQTNASTVRKHVAQV